MAFVLRMVLGPFCCCAPCCRRRTLSSGQIPDRVDDVCADHCPLLGGKSSAEAASLLSKGKKDERKPGQMPAGAEKAMKAARKIAMKSAMGGM